MDSEQVNKLSREVVNEVSKICEDLYKSLPKTGKPTEDEWTVLSCIVQCDRITNAMQVVSLGTGSKCIGASKMSSNGDLLNDSHAEVMARRGFLLYLYDSLHDKSTIFTKRKDKFKLNDNIDFILYSSQLPCGDASIIPKLGEIEDFGEILLCPKRKSGLILDMNTKREKIAVSIHGVDNIKTVNSTKELSESELVSKKCIKEDKLNECFNCTQEGSIAEQVDNSKSIDIHRTGAKCLPNAPFQDPKQVGSNYHILGQVRTKPGRGDRTLSVSCSDKMARWIYLGIQGALLDMLLENPIYIKHFVFGAGVPYSEESLERALLYRQKHKLVALPLVPHFYQSSLEFGCRRSGERHRPSPCSIVWIKRLQDCVQVAVHGRKLGVTKKKMNSTSIRLCISKYELYIKFFKVLCSNEDLKNNILQGKDSIPYNEMKQKSLRYMDSWRILRDNYFQVYTQKPDMWNFCV